MVDFLQSVVQLDTSRPVALWKESFFDAAVVESGQAEGGSRLWRLWADEWQSDHEHIQVPARRDVNVGSLCFEVGAR